MWWGMSFRRLGEGRQFPVDAGIFFTEAAENDFSVVGAGAEVLQDGAQGDFGCLAFGIVVDAGADAGEGDGAQPVCFRDAQGRVVACGKQFGLMVAASLPDRAYGVDDFPARQAVGVGHLAFARAATVQCAAFRQQFRPGGAVYGTVHAPAAQQRAVGRIHDGICLQFRDVAHDDFQV